ncbi:MAG: hypothetical protein HZA54_07130, partial [Planctomycetes bacterium]|nr:hypothetical protein [Planctomycetota bacterium]
MPQLQVQVLIARDIPKSAVVVLNGGVAVDTMAQFQDTFHKLRKLGFMRLVLD